MERCLLAAMTIERCSVTVSVERRAFGCVYLNCTWRVADVAAYGGRATFLPGILVSRDERLCVARDFAGNPSESVITSSVTL